MPWITPLPPRLRSRATGGGRWRGRGSHRLPAAAGAGRKCPASGPNHTACPSAERFGIGRLTGFTDPSGSTQLCYDRRGNIARKLAVVDGLAQNTVWTYNGADRITSIRYPSGSLVSYGRDSLGRIVSLSVTPAGSSPQLLISAVSYYPFGPVRQITWAGGQTQTRSYDQNYWIDQIDSNLSLASALDLDFTLDAVGNITALSDVLGGQPPNNSFVYDELYRLSGAYADGAPVPKAAQEASAAFGFSESYTYDAIGNRTSKTVDVNPAVPYSYGSDSHRLLAVGASGRTYDANGNTTRRDLSSRSDATLVYDERNRLASVSGSGGNASYRHNARGERVLKDAAGKLTRYAFDESGRLLVEDGSASGGAVQQMLWLDDLPVGLLIGTTLYKIQPDHLGSPRKITSGKFSASTLHWDWPILNNPFGATGPNDDPDNDGVSFTLNLRFPGQQYDAETGLNYNYFRDYEAGTGRYVESDPVGLRGGVSTFGYALTSPLSLIDPSGLDVQVCFYPQGVTHVGFGVGSERGTHGFYPRRHRPWDKGEIRPDPEDEPRQCKTIPSNEEQDQCMLKCRATRAKDPGRYDVFRRQCTSFVRDCMRECKVPTGIQPGFDVWQGPRPDRFFGPLPDRPVLFSGTFEG